MRIPGGDSATRRSRDWGIGQRLGLGFGLSLLLLTLLASAVYRWTAQSAAAHEALELRIGPRVHAAQRLQLALVMVALGARDWALEPTAAAVRRHQQRLAEARDALHDLDGLPMDPDGDALFQQLAPRAGAYLSELDSFVASGDRPQLKEELRELSARRGEAIDALDQFVALQVQKEEQALAQIDQARTAAARGTSFAVVAALLLLAAGAWLTWRSIREPSRRLLEVAAALEHGDWHPALAWASLGKGRAQHDEMRLLAQAFGAAAVALEKREQRLRTDRRIASASGSSLSKEAVAEAALSAVCEYAKAEAGALYWVESGGLVPIAAKGVPRGGELAARVVEQKRPLLDPDVPLAAVPVRVHDEVIGVLVVAELRERDPELISFLEAAALQLSFGLQNVKAYSQIHGLMLQLGQKNEQIQAQMEELQAQNEELQVQGEEIRVQVRALKDSEERLRVHARELATVDQRRTEFLAFLAHELRNPLAAISNSLYVLLNARGDGAVRDRAELVMTRQTKQLARLVDDLLDVTRISSGKMRLRLEVVDLASVARECVEDCRGRAAQAGQSLVLELPARPVPVKGDRSRLTQVLGNLLDNAIKFGGQGQPVRLSLVAEPGKQAELTVEDHGVGIDAALLPRLFQPFSQADSSLDRHKSGLGLGLALVKTVIELHGGTVLAQSEGLGRGSRFTVLLPVAEGETRAAAPSRRGALPVPGRRVLIIEDNPDTALAMKDSMELSGHEVRTAQDGTGGLEEARAFLPDVVLCDLGLPGIDGYEVARRIRADDRLEHLFLVALSGYATEADRERSRAAGFDRHLAKPPDIDALEKLIEELPLGDHLLTPSKRASRPSAPR